MTTRNIGRFIISRRTIDDVLARKPEAAAAWSAVFGKCVVIEATHRFDRDAIEYLAFSEDFEPVPVAMEAPVYEVEISRHEGFVGGQRVETFDAKFRKAA